MWLAGAAAATWLLAVSIRIANLVASTTQRHDDDLVSIAIAIIVYSIGYMGLRQPEIFRYDGPAESPPNESPQPAEAAETRYERSGLSDIEAAKLKAALLSLMASEHPYRDPDLTLPELAERLDTTSHKLSEVLNSDLGNTFYDFINGYRVDDVRRRLAESASRNLNVLTLAMDAGFASKSTFNQVFKKLTGHTPSTYRKALAG
jgi:AraC-like DNA-binding protein